MTITCFIRYQIDPFQRDDFVRHAQSWGRIIPREERSLVESVPGTFSVPATAVALAS